MTVATASISKGTNSASKTFHTHSVATNKRVSACPVLSVSQLDSFALTMGK
jgi:hypothetical protein